MSVWNLLEVMIFSQDFDFCFLIEFGTGYHMGLNIFCLTVCYNFQAPSFISSSHSVKQQINIIIIIAYSQQNKLYAFQTLQLIFIVINLNYKMRRILSKNPFTSKINAEFEFISDAQLQTKIKKAHQGFLIHSQRRPQQRADLIGNLGSVFEKNKKEISQLITEQMGKPIKQSQAETDKTINFCKYYSKNYSDLLPTQVKSDAKVKTLIKYLPMGVVYNIIPFNFPFFLAFKGALPNLLLGNAILARNSDSTPILGDKIQQMVRQAGYDSGEYHNVLTSRDQLEQILKNPLIIGVSFTGSSNAGAHISEVAGRYLKKSVMELGGNDPFVVLADADLDLAVQNAVKSRSANAGQVCFSPKRFIIVKEVYDKFKEKLIEKLNSLKYGNPHDETTDVGPLAREDLYDNLADQIRKMPNSWKVGWQKQNIQKPLYPITVLQASTTQLYDQQLFGPIFTLFKADNESHAIKIANSSQYGLAASVYSRSRGEEVVDQIRSGMAFVNAIVKSDYCYPSGGVGKSGYGRQCSTEGLRSFANVKTHYVN